MLKMNLPDSHTHTLFSPDSEEPVEKLCAAAAEKGISHLTITDHCECNDFEKDSYGERIRGSFAAVKAQQGSFGKLQILCGVELAQPMQNPQAARKLLSSHAFDFVLGSIHAIRGKQDFYFLDYTSMDDPCALLDRYFEEELELVRDWGDFDSLAHLTYPLRYLMGEYGVPVDLRRFSGIIDEIFRTLIRSGRALEVNTSGLRQKIGKLLPDREFLQRYRELGGKLVTIGSDAHKAADAGSGLEEGAAVLRSCGFAEIAVYEKRNPRLLPL
ncbi:histidinol-phosphatase HisJ family protein [Anaeromassilibacillus sp. An200]|uniref:histidinol-phosphatase HisJ family protein n=1 Tax=Anaeromassilibacillus sp. An200 TaxID=1965587 RepID=UPI000B370D67|nr:histidinol-phosphatase HisJ family protein [Anaeromassilibacillus sp. An200]